MILARLAPSFADIEVVRVVQVLLQLSGADDMETDDITLAARKVLRELPVDDVTAPTVAAQAGTRGETVALIGQLVLTMASTPEVVQAVSAGLADWLRRQRPGRVRVRIGDAEIEVDGPSDDVAGRLTDAFIAHAERTGR
ncbi:hypothetical protein KZZ52_32965 [Dactylosporangium sp. AC04546]|uniref:hypothetical protein n=1 Tax=Dactylosporangium sp. AC04546 TaxID=2862460 RepID=UPI002E7C3EA0|nr:hypothetical protein [Dactylosporangium sp. AC04546]WVK78803.1 hypothetical protein KZZ52_32965 [Dactylosporangium sp. AC04546]